MDSLKGRIAKLEQVLCARSGSESKRAGQRRMAAIFNVQADAVTIPPSSRDFTTPDDLLRYARTRADAVPMALKAAVDCDTLTAAALQCWTNPADDSQLARLAIEAMAQLSGQNRTP